MVNDERTNDLWRMIRDKPATFPGQMAETMNLQADTAPETIPLQMPGQLYARAKQAAGQDQQRLNNCW